MADGNGGGGGDDLAHMTVSSRIMKEFSSNLLGTLPKRRQAGGKMTTPSSLSPCSLSMASCFPTLALSRPGIRVVAYATLSSGAVTFLFPTPSHP